MKSLKDPRNEYKKRNGIIPKINDICIALNRIADNRGEEFEDVYILQKKFNIMITDEEGPAFRANQKAIWIKEPYDSEKYEILLKIFSFWSEAYIPKQYILKIEENKKKILKYPLSIEIAVVSDNIWDELINFYDINPKNYNENEHEFIINTREWQRCELEVARDLIGTKLLNKMTRI